MRDNSTAEHLDQHAHATTPPLGTATSYAVPYGVHSAPSFDWTMHSVKSVAVSPRFNLAYLYIEDLANPLRYSTGGAEAVVTDCGDPAVPEQSRRGVFSLRLDRQSFLGTPFCPRVTDNTSATLHTSCANCVLGNPTQFSDLLVLCSSCPGPNNASQWPAAAAPAVYYLQDDLFQAIWFRTLGFDDLFNRQTRPEVFSASFGSILWQGRTVFLMFYSRPYVGVTPSNQPGRGMLVAADSILGTVVAYTAFNVSLAVPAGYRACQSALNSPTALFVCDGADTLVFTMQYNSSSSLTSFQLSNRLAGWSSMGRVDAPNVFYSTATSAAAVHADMSSTRIASADGVVSATHQPGELEPTSHDLSVPPLTADTSVMLTVSQLNPYTGEPIWTVNESSVQNFSCTSYDNPSTQLKAPVYLQLPPYVRTNYSISTLLVAVQRQQGSCIVFIDTTKGIVVHANWLNVTDIIALDSDETGLLYMQTPRRLWSVVIDTAAVNWTVPFDSGSGAWFSVFQNFILTSSKDSMLASLKPGMSMHRWSSLITAPA